MEMANGFNWQESRSEFKIWNKCENRFGSYHADFDEMVSRPLIFNYLGRKVVVPFGTKRMIWSSKSPPSSGSIAPTLTMQKASKDRWSSSQLIFLAKAQEGLRVDSDSGPIFNRPTLPILFLPFILCQLSLFIPPRLGPGTNPHADSSFSG